MGMVSPQGKQRRKPLAAWTQPPRPRQKPNAGAHGERPFPRAANSQHGGSRTRAVTVSRSGRPTDSAGVAFATTQKLIVSTRF